MVIPIPDVLGRVEATKTLKIFNEMRLVGITGFVGNIGPNDFMLLMYSLQQFVEPKDSVQYFGG